VPNSHSLLKIKKIELSETRFVGRNRKRIYILFRFCRTSKYYPKRVECFLYGIFLERDNLIWGLKDPRSNEKLERMSLGSMVWTPTQSFIINISPSAKPILRIHHINLQKNNKIRKNHHATFLQTQLFHVGMRVITILMVYPGI